MLSIVLVQGCATVTYPSPQSVEGDHITLHFPHHSDSSGTFLNAIDAMCTGGVRGSTRAQLVFSVEGGVGFCFSAPITGTRRIGTDPELEYSTPCARGPLGGVRGPSHMLIFQVLVVSKDDDLNPDQAQGGLEGKVEAAHALARVQVRSFLDMPPGINVNGKLRYDVDGSWVSFAEAAPHFTRKAYALAFGFDQDCDPDARYRLSVTGITRNGRAVLVPTVDFAPRREAVSPID